MSLGIQPNFYLLRSEKDVLKIAEEFKSNIEKFNNPHKDRYDISLRIDNVPVQMTASQWDNPSLIIGGEGIDMNLQIKKYIEEQAQVRLF